MARDIDSILSQIDPNWLQRWNSSLDRFPRESLSWITMEENGGGGGQGDPASQGDPAGGAGDPDLGDAGKRALDAERTRAKSEEKARKAAERRASELEARLAQLEENGKSESEKLLAQARKEADQAARTEERSRAARRILTSEIKAAAGGKLADPADAVRLLDLDEFKVDDDGEVDAKSISSAIEGLLKDKPYLAAKSTATVGSADGGSRGSETKPEVTPGLGRLRAAYASK